MLPAHLDRADYAVRQNLLARRQAGQGTGAGRRPRTVSKRAETTAIIGYMACSSLMLITNKIAIYNVPAPSFVLWSQMAFAGSECY